ncbi:hypothetical protein JCM10212_005893 [Sporobolomyces blumeae]
MPIKRTAEELERPPLPRGSACHRCFVRKVRCSGQPDPSTGLHGCTSCVRTARHRGHDVKQVRCAFEREGLCSEEGGPTMSGEVLPGSASTGPTRRQRPSARSTPSSSTNSSRSGVSTSSGSRADSFSTDASSVLPSASTRSPRVGSSTFPNDVPPSPKTFQYLPQFPSSHPVPLPPTAMPLGQQHVGSSKVPVPEPELSAVAGAGMQTILQRRANAPQRQMSLTTASTPSDGSPYPNLSPFLGDTKTQASAPIAPPAAWGRPVASHYPEYSGGGQHIPFPPCYLDGPLPNTSFALDLAPFSALNPSTLAKLNLTPTSTYESAPTQRQHSFSHGQVTHEAASGLTQPSFSPSGVAFTGLNLSSHRDPTDPVFSSSLAGFAAPAVPSTSHHEQPQSTLPGTPLGYPSTSTYSSFAPPQADQDASQLYQHYAPPDLAHAERPQPLQYQPYGAHLEPGPGTSSSFHLPSPGLTFSSSVPHGFREPRQDFGGPG